MNNCVYTFYVIGSDGLPMYPYEMGDQICLIGVWTINLARAVTWAKPEDFDCLMNEYESAVVVAVYNKGGKDG